MSTTAVTNNLPAPITISPFATEVPADVSKVVSATLDAPQPQPAVTDLNSLPVKDYVPSARVAKIYKTLIRDVDIPRFHFKVKQDAEDNPQIVTPDGYTVTLKGKDQDWTITSPDNKTTRIWGDPHVVNSDGTKWDFYNDSTFVFGDNKVTVETVDAGNNTTYSGTITIYNGRERFTISDIDKNKPTLSAWSLDGISHDQNLADGDAYQLERTGSGHHKWQINK